MTTAYDFPDLNISPILGEEDVDGEADEQNLRGYKELRRVDVPIQDALKGLSISKSSSSGNTSVESSSGEIVKGIHRRSAYLYSQDEDSFDASSEGAFAALECEMKRSLFSVAESCDLGADLQESFCSILSGCRISVEMGCCTESSEDVRSRLRRMGAIVSRHFTETTTHVVFSFGGRAAILRRVFAVSKKPFLVDPHWVYECFKTRTRVSEEQYSLYDCRFLVNALRRSMDVERSRGDDAGEHGLTSTSHINEERVQLRQTSEDEEVTFSRSMSASELLMKIDLLSKRLDRIGGATSCVLGIRCPSVLKGKLLSTVIPQKSTAKTPRNEVLRRRTHCAFPLEFREPNSIAVQLTREMRDEQDAVSGRPKRYEFLEVSPNKENLGSKYASGRYKSYTQYKPTVRKHGAETGDTVDLQESRRCLKPIENSSEMGGLLGFRAPSHGGMYGPLVETASSMINHLQLASTSEEFVSKKQTRIANKNRNGVVFTGFPKEKERTLHSTVTGLGLKVQSKITARTYCVISANGERTLNTMRAVVSGIPVVKAEWIDVCVERNEFLSLDRFHYERWQTLIQKRGQQCRLFSDVGKIFVCDGCSPPSEDIEWIITGSGGEVTNKASDCALVVAPRDQSLEILCSEDVEFPPPVVVEKYILDCVSENEILAINDYMEHDVIDDIC